MLRAANAADLTRAVVKVLIGIADQDRLQSAKHSILNSSEQELKGKYFTRRLDIGKSPA